jgi:prevent-host-death family protein
MRWQVQEAKQRFSEMIRAVQDDGPQVVTRHGLDIAVVIDVAEFKRLRGEISEFKDYLRSGPDFDELDLSRPDERPRDTEWADEA